MLQRAAVTTAGWCHTLSIDATHPSLDGHFPGRPVVPGVLLVATIIDLAEQRLGRPLAIVGAPQVKFLRPLLPGESATAEISLVATQLQFELVGSGKPIARGTLTLRATGVP